MKKGPQQIFPSRVSLVSRFDSKKLLILMVVVIVTIMIDSEIGIVISDRLSSNMGIVAFIGIATIFTVTQHFILAYIK